MLHDEECTVHLVMHPIWMDEKCILCEYMLWILSPPWHFSFIWVGSSLSLVIVGSLCRVTLVKIDASKAILIIMKEWYKEVLSSLNSK